MGLYSTNRIGAFSESAEQIADIVKEIEETAYDPNFGSLLEIPIMLQENDQRMFESLIEADFISVTNEAVMLEAEAQKANSEANKTKVQAIKEKISQIIETVISAIKKAAANFIAKVMSVIKNDKKIIDSYSSTLNEKNLEGFAGIKDFAFPKNVDAKNFVSDKVVSYSDDLAKLRAEIMDDDATKESINDVAEKIIQKYKFDSKDDKKENFNNEKSTIDSTLFEEKVAAFVPNNSQIEVMKKKLSNANETLKAVKETAAGLIARLKAAKAAASKGMKNKEHEEFAVAADSASYNVVSAMCKHATKVLSMAINGVSRQIAAYRKCWILCGRYAAKKAKGGEKSKETATAESVALEEAMQIALAESSDIYVFERLGYGIY